MIVEDAGVSTIDGAAMVVKPAMLACCVFPVATIVKVTVPADGSTPRAPVLSVTVVSAPAAMLPPLRVKSTCVLVPVISAELNVGLPPASDTVYKEFEMPVASVAKTAALAVIDTVSLEVVTAVAGRKVKTICVG